jgi:hypothetical protein
LFYKERQLDPKIEQEIKEGFFEIKKKYSPGKGDNDNSVVQTTIIQSTKDINFQAF